MAFHHILFGVVDQAELRSRLQALAERHGVVFGTPRTVSARPPLPGDCPPCRDTAPVVPVWQWAGTIADLRAAARRVLNHFVYPLVAQERPFCVAFPFGSEQLTPGALDAQQLRLLDLEDIAALLDAGAPQRLAHSGVAAAALQGLDPDQRAAACHGGGPARVLAAAGSGKTKTMVARIAALVARGTPPRSILVLAFNAEAALQLEERLAAAGVPTTRRIERDAGGVHCATFNAFGYRFQQQVLGGAPTVAAGGAAQEKLLRLALAEDRAHVQGRCSSLSRVAGEGPETGHAQPADRSQLASDPYDAALTDAAYSLGQALDSWRAKLITPDAAHGSAIERYNRLQNTRGVQTFDDQVIATVCALLAEPEHRRLLHEIYQFVLVDEFQDVNPAQQALLDILSRPWRNLFVVGDDDQLIYGWRAANASGIIDFGADLPPAPHTAFYTLPTNYRCSRQVVARAEQLVVHNRRRAGKSMRARPSAPPGSVLFAAAADRCELSLELAAFLAIERLRLGCAWSNLAVLARFRAQLETLRGALRHMGIPIGVPKPDSTLDPVWAARLDGMLRAALDDDRLRDLTPTTLLECVAATVPSFDEAAQNVLDAARLLACDHATPAGLVGAWRRLAPVNPAAGRDTTQSTPRSRPDGVTMATVHSTKGREYASVAIVDFAPALQPLSADEQEEERRVLYVALTRARHSALLTVPKSDHGPHPFIRELGRPPLRAESRSLRRGAAHDHDELRRNADALPPALRELLHLSQGTNSAGSGPPDPALGEAAARLLHARSRLLERRLFGPRPLAGFLSVLRE